VGGPGQDTAAGGPGLDDCFGAYLTMRSCESP
jgi:hypothetical protein